MLRPEKSSFGKEESGSESPTSKSLEALRVNQATNYIAFDALDQACRTVPEKLEWKRTVVGAEPEDISK